MCTNLHLIGTKKKINPETTESVSVKSWMDNSLHQSG